MVYSSEGGYRCDSFPVVMSTAHTEGSPVPFIVGIEVHGRRPSSSVGGFGASGRVVFHGFSDWVNIISTDARIAQTVRAGIGEPFGVLARGLMLGRSSGGLEVLELHYSSKPGKPYDPIFKSRSTFDGTSGLKLAERDTLGSKEREYYPVWPVSDAPLLAIQ